MLLSEVAKITGAKDKHKKVRAKKKGSRPVKQASVEKRSEQEETV